MAIRTRLELATSAVTGRRSNQIELPDRERFCMIAFFDFSATIFPLPFEDNFVKFDEKNIGNNFTQVFKFLICLWDCPWGRVLIY